MLKYLIPDGGNKKDIITKRVGLVQSEPHHHLIEN
jgi:hypothetical protein